MSDHFGKRGEEARGAILTDDQVREIKLALRGGASVKEVAEKFGISPTTIYAIRRGSRWAHVKVTRENAQV